MKVPDIQNSTNSVQWEPKCLMRTDRQTDRQADMAKLTVANRTCFAREAKNLTFGRLMSTTVDVPHR